MGSATLAPGERARVWSLPRDWVISFAVHFAGPRDTLRIGLGSSAVTIYDGGHGWHHARLTERTLTVDGHSSVLPASNAATISLRATGGQAQIRSLRIGQA